MKNEHTHKKGKKRKGKKSHMDGEEGTQEEEKGKIEDFRSY